MLFNKKKDIFLNNSEVSKFSDKYRIWKQLQNYIIAIAPNNDIFSVGPDGSILFRSTDNGDSWDSVGSSSYFGIMDLMTFDYDSTYYIESYGPRNIFRSTNYGKKWEKLFLPEVQDISVDSNGILIISSEGFIFRSTNKGTDWSKVTEGVYYGNITSGKGGNIFLSGQYGGDSSFRSSDDGKTWSALPFHVGKFAASPSGRILFAGIGINNRVIEYSDDYGITWKVYGDLKKWNLDTAAVTFLCADPDSGFYLQAGGVLFYANHPELNPWNIVSFPTSNVQSITVNVDGSILVSQQNQNVLSISNDIGNSWKPVLGIFSDGIHTLLRDSSKRIIAIGNRNLSETEDNGKTWLKLNNPSDTTLHSCVIQQNGEIFLSPNYSDTIFRSTDNAQSWKKSVPTPFNDFGYNLSAVHGELFASGDSPVISSDNGLSWSFLPWDNRFFILYSVVTDLYGDLYGATNYMPKEYTSVIRSFDNGLTWSLFDSGLDRSYPNTINGLLSTPDGTVFAYTADSGVYKYSPGDCHWIRYSDGLQIKDITTLTYDKSGRLYAGSDGGGVYISTQTFNKVPILGGRLLARDLDFGSVLVGKSFCKDVTIKNTGLAPFTLQSFTVEDPTPFSVSDESAKKLPLVLAPHDSVAMTICFHPHQPAVYTSKIIWNTDIDASICTGIPSESDLHGVSVEKNALTPAPLPEYREREIDISPNPIHDKAELHFSLAKESHVKIKCFDLLGRSVKVLAEGNFDFGEHSLSCDLSDVSDGMYIIECNIGAEKISQSVIVLH